MQPTAADLQRYCQLAITWHRVLPQLSWLMEPGSAKCLQGTPALEDASAPSASAWTSNHTN